jgi:hypothetical protein
MNFLLRKYTPKVWKLLGNCEQFYYVSKNSPSIYAFFTVYEMFSLPVFFYTVKYILYILYMYRLGPDFVINCFVFNKFYFRFGTF